MLRVVLVDILLFLLPFLIYAAYMVWVKGMAPKNIMAGAPILWLVTSGFVCLIVGLLMIINFSGGDRAGTYHPSTLDEGVIRPGSID